MKTFFGKGSCKNCHGTGVIVAYSRRGTPFTAIALGGHGMFVDKSRNDSNQVICGLCQGTGTKNAFAVAK